MMRERERLVAPVHDAPGMHLGRRAGWHAFNLLPFMLWQLWPFLYPLFSIPHVSHTYRVPAESCIWAGGACLKGQTSAAQTAQ